MGIFRERIGAFNNLLNLKLSHNVGENAQGGVRLGIAARSAYEINHHLAFGIEYFSRLGQLDNMPSFDEQSHQVGPVILLTPFEDVHMHSSLGYLLGISDSATDGAVKFEIGFEF